jgi:rSAM/selenodomain-associated transferase 1
MIYEFPQALLIQFAKAPEIGKVKTRMQPHLTAQQCLSLHCRLVIHTYHTLTQSCLAPLELWTAGEDESQFFEGLKPMPGLREQYGADLGLRMHYALLAGLQRYEAVVLVGSDCPFLTEDVLRQALEALSGDVDCVLGPATDGGYVLIGVTRSHEELFEGVSWGTAQVLEQTRLRLDKLAWRWLELTPLADIDTPEDLNLITSWKQYYN